MGSPWNRGEIRLEVDKTIFRLERDAKLGALEERADALQDGSAQFEKQAAAMKNKFWLENLKSMIAMGVVGVIVLGLLYWKFFMDTGPQYPPPGYYPPPPPPPPPAAPAAVAAGTFQNVKMFEKKNFHKLSSAVGLSKYDSLSTNCTWQSHSASMIMTLVSAHHIHLAKMISLYWLHQVQWPLKHRRFSVHSCVNLRLDSQMNRL